MIDFAKLVLAADTSQIKQAATDLGLLRQSGVAAEAQTTRSAAAMSSAFKSVALAAGGLLAAFSAAMSFRTFVSATSEMEKSQAQLAAVLQSTQGAAGLAIEELNATAVALQRVTTYGDDAISAMQGVLLTFTQVKGDNFNRATRSILNLSTAMSMDLNSAALQVGKALNNPIQGLSALGRAGIQFSDDQKVAIETMMELGDVAGAQNIILQELERQFGGSAEAARGTLGGALTALGEAWGDLFELSGPAADGLRESVERLIDMVTDPSFVSAVQKFGNAMFRAANLASEAFTGLAMIVQDVGYLIGWSDQTWAMEQAANAAAEALNLEVAALNGIVGPMQGNITMSKAVAQAKLDEVKARMAVIDSMREEAMEAVRQTEAYQEAQAQGLAATEALENLMRAQAETKIDPSQFGSLNPILPYADSIAMATNELLAALDAQLALTGEAGRTSSEYLALEAAVTTLQAQINASSGEMVVFKGEVLGTGAAATRLSSVLGAMTMSDQANAQAQFLARDLGVALDVAVRLNAVLNQNANITIPDAAPALGFGGIGSTMDDPLSTGLANAALGFGDLTNAADETWRAVEDLSTGMGNLAAATGGGTAGGGATEATSALEEEMRRATEAILDEAEAIREYEDQLAGPLNSAIDQTVDNMVNGFEGGLGSIKETFSSAIKDMVAFALKNQIQLSLSGSTSGGMGGIMSSFTSGATSWLTGGMQAGTQALAGVSSGLAGFAGALGAVAGPLALVTGIMGIFGQRSRARAEAEKKEAQERDKLMMQKLALMGDEDELNRIKIESYAESNEALAKEVMLLEQKKNIEGERAGLEQELLTLQGDTKELRKIELQALDESNRELQKRIYHLEEEQARTAEAASLEQQLLTLEGDTAALRKLELQTIDPLNRELQKQIWAMEDQAAILQERADLEKQLLEAQGDTAALRALELEALDESNRAIQEEIWALEDAAAVEEERQSIMESMLTTQEKTNALRLLELQALDPLNRALQVYAWHLEDQAAIAEERQSLEEELLQVQGDTAALRELELAALDESNRALQEQIWALEDAAVAEEEAARAAEEAEAAAKSVADERASLEKELLQLQGDTAALRALELAALDESNQALQKQIWALEDYKEALDEVTAENYTTLIDYNRALAQAATGMANPANSPGAPSYINPVSPVTPAVTMEPNGDPLLAEVRALREETRQLLTQIDKSTKKEADISTKWDNVGLPPERAA